MLAYIYHCIRPPFTKPNSPVQHHSNRKKDAMNLLFICIAVQLLFLCPSINAAENGSEPCIRNYEELRRALRDNETNNIATLFNAFHPPNSQEVQVAGIMYCIGDNKTFCSDKQVDEELEHMHMNYTFRWAANALLLVQEYELINALVFNLFQFNYVNIPLIINPPFCDDVSEKDKIDNLRFLTTWVSCEY
uniref:Uncharacterized protein n=1 Tax=Amphimedon queenslandica TaxID=400682 RepID=A0A1X7TYE6_AMPQE